MDKTDEPMVNEASGAQLPIVLVVDDVPDNLRTLAEMLRALGVGVRVASNGPTAVRYAGLLPRPDLILLDIMMPDMDGYVVLRALREAPETQDIPVIFITALDSPDEERLGLQAGAVDYITKPINVTVLRARVETQLELARARRRLAQQNAWLSEQVELRVSEALALQQRLELTLEASGLGVWELDGATPELMQVRWSHSFVSMLGRAAAPDQLADWLSWIHEADRQALHHAVEFRQDLPALTVRMAHQDGRWRWMEMRGQWVDQGEGAPTLLAGVIADVTDRFEAEKAQRLSAAVFAGIRDGVCITDAQASIVMVNAAFTRLTGYSEAEVLGQNPHLLSSGVHSLTFYRDLWSTLLNEDNWQGEITNRRKDGALITEWLSISAVRDASGQVKHYVAIFSDLSEHKAAANRIQYLATYDPLTDLPNRNLFADRLTQSLLNMHRFKRQTAVILLDLDRFGSINDTLGAPIGDEALSEVGRRLLCQVREGDTVGRRGGNEFGFVMANMAHESDAITLAQRMLEAIAQPFNVQGTSFTLTASVGISVAPRDGDTADQLLQAADIALQRAKVAGRNGFRFYSPGMDAHAARRLSLEVALREAVPRGQLYLVYQPQISLESGQLIGMESLLRWQHPDFGLVSPMEFIPIAEDTGLIIPIGAWVLEQACLQTRRWLDLGLAQLRVAVNLSIRQFRQPNLVQFVADTLARTGLPPGALEIEITESAFIDDVELAVAQSNALKRLGVMLSLDDFGTGYSSLAYLSRFPFDKLKIDQGFVRDITENPVNAAIATAAIVMGRSLNLTVLAEGVETEAQARFLRGRRCDSMQGYLFSRPLAQEDFEQLLIGRRTLSMSVCEDDAGKTLLMLDDEPYVLAALTRLFRREGYRILSASTPGEAFELLAKHQVHVVLCDQRMPEMSGTEFLSRVRQLYPHTLRMVLTGHSDLEAATDAINRGAIFKFIHKPWDDDQLRDVMREAFRLSRESRDPIL